MHLEESRKDEAKLEVRKIYIDTEKVEEEVVSLEVENKRKT